MRNRRKKSFMEWIPNGIMASICDIPPKGMKVGLRGPSTALVFLLSTAD